jgi:hypothetical protein
VSKYLTLANKLSGTQLQFVSIDSLLNDDKNEVSIFFLFLKNQEYVVKIDEIFNFISEKKILSIFSKTTDNLFDIDDKLLLMAIFIFKSVIKMTITPSTTNVRYINSDLVINNIHDYYSKFLIYFFSRDIEDSLQFKKKIFSALSTLSEWKIIKERVIRINNKTIKEWSFGFHTLIIGSREYLNLNKNKFSIVNIGNNFYLKGCFFTNVHKIFEENLKSGEKFEFKTTNYLYSLVNSKYYLNNSDLADVISIIEIKEKINQQTLIEDIERCNSLLENSFNSARLFQKNLKKKYLTICKEIIDNKYSSFLNEENVTFDFLSKVFLDYCSKYLFEKKKIIINKECYWDFENRLEEIFKQNYKSQMTGRRDVSEERLVNSMLAPDYNEPNSSDSDTDVDEKSSELRLIKEFNLYDIVKRFKNDKIREILDKNSQVFNNLKSGSMPRSIRACTEADIYFFGVKFLLHDLWKNYYNEKKKKKDENIETNKMYYSRISKLLVIYNLYLLKELNWPDEDPVYLPFFFDFRGRMYYKSSVSPTTLKYSRYVFNYGIYTDAEINDNTRNIISPIIEKFNDHIELVKKMYLIDKNSLKINESIFWVLISIGKIGIVKEKIAIHVKEIIDIGVNILKSWSEDNIGAYSLIDMIEINHYKKILLSFKSNKIIARGVVKDATASFIQNLIRLMGYKDEISLKYANLNSSEYWYDTYSFILSKWIEDEKEKNKNLDHLKFFERKTVKKPIMTNPYAAVYMTAFAYFRDAVKERTGLSIDYGSKEEVAFKRFYKFISTEVEDRFFLKNNSKKIVEHIKNILSENNEEIIVKSHDSYSNMIYYKMVSKSYDLIIVVPAKDKKRITKKYEKFNNLNIDHQKIARSIRANWVHYIDALLIRDINRNSKKIYITIHDCFIVDCLSVSDFIINANNQSSIKIFESLEWNINNKKKFFSIFIFI